MPEAIGRTIQTATAEGQQMPLPAYSAASASAERCVIGLEPLYASSCRCLKNVSYKYSAQNFCLHAMEAVLALHMVLAAGTYKEGKTHIVYITYPKKREALSIDFRDRVVQRSFNDNVLYPVMTKGFIKANFACQKGKGTDAARDYYKAKLHSAFINNGNSNDFVIITIDVKGYYENMRHEITNQMFKEKLDSWSAAFVVRTLDKQYKGETGYNPGSQMVQIAGISYLNPFDHFVKEVLRIKYYIRYMDDIHIFAKKEDAAWIIQKSGEKLAEVGLRMHPVKTRVVKASEGALFLGFKYRVTETGKVIMLRDPAKVKDNRRHLRKLANLVKKGLRPIKAFDDSWQCIRAVLAMGDSKKLLRRMDDFVAILREEMKNAELVLPAEA